MRTFIRVMKALSDPNRVGIVKVLEQGELCVCEIQELLGLAQSTVSRHLKVLEDAGLVGSRKEGSWIIYRLAGGDVAYAGPMLGHLKTWHNDDPAVCRMRAALPGLDRERICARSRSDGPPPLRREARVRPARD